MDKLNFFSHEKISEHLYIFTEGYSMVHRFTIGVVIGTEKILVIDAGMGLGGSLREAIEEAVGTDKPMICACTHCHPDHVGSAKLFDEAYVSHLDWPARADFALSTEQRLSDLHGFGLNSPEVEAYCREHYIDNTDSTFLDIQDGDVFDLGGGVKIQAIEVPGHSLGSMAFWNQAEDYVFTGDAINTDVHLKKLDKAGFVEYKKTLQRFISIVGDTARVYPAHLPLTMDMQIAKNLVQVCDDLVAGRTMGDPPGETIFAERNNNPDIRMHFYHNTCIVYNRKLVEAPVDPTGYLNFYSYEQISDRVYVVTENYSMVHRFTIGVVVGDEKILVVDSGLGMDSDLRTYIEGIVGKEKPMICVCSHGAIDHAGAACLFDEAFLNDRDREMLPSAFDPARRMRDLGAFSLFNDEVVAYGRTHMVDNRNSQFTPVDEGDVFDLGGIEVRPIRTPGHSKGHLAYWIPSEKIAFVGDGINADTHLKKLDRQGLLDYSAMLQRFLSIVGEDITMYAGHLNRAHKANVARNLAAACEEVANGQTAGDPPGETIFLEKAGNLAMRMHYHGNDCIIYNSDLLK
jgi:glyoxylase-like metal-dependent hydrolase (beta-lactamase superfamily II)